MRVLLRVNTPKLYVPLPVTTDETSTLPHDDPRMDPDLLRTGDEKAGWLLYVIPVSLQVVLAIDRTLKPSLEPSTAYSRSVA